MSHKYTNIFKNCNWSFYCTPTGPPWAPADPHKDIREKWNGKKGPACNIEFRDPNSAHLQWMGYVDGAGPSWATDLLYRVKLKPNEVVREQWNGESGPDCNVEYYVEEGDGWFGYTEGTIPRWRDYIKYRVKPESVPIIVKEEILPEYMDTYRQWNGKSGRDCNIEFHTGERWHHYMSGKPIWNIGGWKYRVVPDKHMGVARQWNNKEGQYCNIQYRLNGFCFWHQPAYGSPCWIDDAEYQVKP